MRNKNMEYTIHCDCYWLQAQNESFLHNFSFVEFFFVGFFFIPRIYAIHLCFSCIRNISQDFGFVFVFSPKARRMPHGDSMSLPNHFSTKCRLLKRATTARFFHSHSVSSERFFLYYLLWSSTDKNSYAMCRMMTNICMRMLFFH